MIKVIGLSGLAGSGKDYVYKKYLFPKGWKQFSLAWHFKTDLIAKGVMTYEEASTNPKPEWVRNVLQIQGTELGRNLYGKDIWLKTARTWMQTLYDSWEIDKFVIPDVRFFNELDFIKYEMKGVAFRIIAPNRESQSGLTVDQRAHSSEAEMMQMSDNAFNGIIYNDPDADPSVQDQVDVLLKTVNYFD